LKNNLSNKIEMTLLSAFLILIIGATAVAVPNAFAHDPAWTVPNFCYIFVSPTTVGVNQQALVIFWVNTYPPTAAGAVGDRWKFFIDITAPDGSKSTVGPIMSDPIGGGYYTFTPDKTGTYSFVVRFPAQVVTGLPGYLGTPTTPINNAAVNDTYGPSQSHVEYLTVQQAPIQGYQETPLPTGYWTRPISGINRNWYVATGNWLAFAAAQSNGPTTGFAYGSATESAHVLWSRPVASGGITDDQFGTLSSSSYHYAGLSFSPPIIIDGKMYYNNPQNPVYGQWCIDLYTGETLYFRNSTGAVAGQTQGTGFDPYGSMTTGLITSGWIYNPELPNQHGTYNYLISTATGITNQWNIYDAFTGNWICSVANVSTTGATAFYGADGSYTYYSISGSGATQRLLCWNLTRSIWYKSYYGLYYPATDRGTELPANTTSNTYWMWRPYLNYTFDGRNGFSINVTMQTAINSNLNTIRAVREGQFIIGGSAGSNPPGGPLTPGVLWCINLDPAQGDIGKLLWNRTFTPPQTAGNITVTLAKVDPEDGVFYFSSAQKLAYWCYSLNTMNELWGPDTGVPAENDGNFYGMNNYVYQGKLITCGYGGQLRAYNITTGKILWVYNATTIPFESPYGNNYPMGVGCIADGKIYIGTGEHSPTEPIWRGNVLQCINATDGSVIWNFPCYGVSMSSGNAGYNFAIADGRLLALNAYDNSIYCFGKGPTATTVSAPNVAVPQGTAVMISGTVTDQSPSGRLNVNYDLDVPLKGTPAISDVDMSNWMQYLYQQRPMPANAKGVQVHLTAIDPNGNTQDIGVTTSDISGNYGITWTPPVPGPYKITATFDGSKSYGSSFGTTYLAVSKPTQSIVVTPTPAPSQTITPASPTPAQTVSPSLTQAPQPTSGVPTSTYLAIGAAVIIIIAATAALLLRRRK
jgi:outer membrane protein assembly factor BamB